MEILFISHKYPPTIGGMEKQSFELVTNIQSKARVHKLVFTGENESKISFFYNLKRNVKKILKENPSIDMIHLNDGLMGVFCTWLKKYTDIPVIITFHGLDLVFPNYFYQRVIKNKFTNYDAAICVSSATAQEAINRSFNKDKVHVVPNGVDTSLAATSFDQNKIRDFISKEYNIDLKGKKVLVMLGRPVKRKGFSWFLNNVIPHLDDNVVTLMVGPLSKPKKKTILSYLIPKKLQEKLELVMGGVNDEKAVALSLAKDIYKGKVVQTGKLPFDTLLSVLNLAELFIMPNIKKEGDMEGFGLVALEAALCETVVLASNIDGIPDAIQDNKNGFLLPSGDSKVWIDTIHKTLSDPQTLMVKSQEFKDFTLKNYGWEKMAQGYLDIFTKYIK